MKKTAIVRNLDGDFSTVEFIGSADDDVDTTVSLVSASYDSDVGEGMFDEEEMEIVCICTGEVDMW